jgi:hypothetical protein
MSIEKDQGKEIDEMLSSLGVAPVSGIFYLHFINFFKIIYFNYFRCIVKFNHFTKQK